MAVIRLVYSSRHADCGVAGRPVPFCHWRTDSAGAGDVTEWQGPEDVLIHWGDPTVQPAVAELRAQAQGKRARPLFGRSWLHFHRPSHRLTVVPDALGAYPVLLQHDRDRARIASDALAMVDLLGSRALVDYGAALELLSWGELRGTRTTLAGVARVEPGSVAVATHRDLAFHTPPLESPLQPLPEEADLCDALVAAVEQCFDHAPQAMLHMGDPAWKLLLAAALAGGARPTLVNASPDRDRHLAANVAKRCGLNLLQGSDAPEHRRRAYLGIALAGGGEVPLHRGHEKLCEDLLSVTAGATLVTATGMGLGLAEPGTGRYTLSGQGIHPRPTGLPFQGLGRGAVADLQLLDRHYARAHPLLNPRWLGLLASLPESLRRDPGLPQRLIHHLAPRLDGLGSISTAGRHLRLVSNRDQPLALPSPVDDSATVHNMLRACGLTAAAANALERRLPTGPDRLHALGVAGAFNRWTRYLERSRRARAA